MAVGAWERLLYHALHTGRDPGHLVSALHCRAQTLCRYFFLCFDFPWFSLRGSPSVLGPRTSTGDNTFETNFSPAASSKPESKNTYNCMKSGTLDCVPAYQSYACMQEIHACVLTAHKHANYMLFSNAVLLSAAVVHPAPLGGSLFPGPSQWQRRGVL